MPGLAWNNFDGTYFQRFCNALLFFEVSKFAHVFTAPGKDGGIDQLFKGGYDGKQGVWRFQDKFHNSSRRTDDIAALKREIRTDLTENYNGENFIVFITNVNLNPAKYEEFILEAEKLITDKGIKNCEFLLWHEAIIETLLTVHPILYQQFWDRDTILLQTYSEYFAHQLDNQSADTRYQLKNSFFGREESIQTLKAFLLNDKVSTIAVIANGGYGKTRLVIEFFRSIVDLNDEWFPLVLSHTGFNANRFSQLLKTPKRIILLIDNAHEVPEIVADVKRLVDNSKGKDKLILTTRMTLFSEIVEKIPTHSRDIEKLLLGNLFYDERKRMIQAELPGLKESNLIHLAEVSKGVPNVILEYVRLILNGKQPHEITNESAFAESVREIFSQAIEDIARKTSITAEKINDFIKLIALISPLESDDISKAFVAEVIDLRKDKLELLITSFGELGLMDYKNIITIKPDPYSDFILNDTIQKNKAFVEHIKDFKGSEKYLENILKNLAEAEIEDKEKEYFIDNLVTGYVRLISDPATDPFKIKSIFELVEKIALKKIPIALYAVKEFIIIYENKEHPIHKATDTWKTKTTIEEVADIAYQILHNLATYSQYSLDNKEEIFSLARAFAKAIGKFNILQGCFGYHEWDFPYFGYSPSACIEKQLFFKTKLCGLMETNNSITDLDMALFGANFLLELEFPTREYFEQATGQFKYGIAQVPDCVHVLAMRSDIIQSLIIFYKRDLDVPYLKTRALNELLASFWYASEGYKSRHKQDFSNDIKVIFSFFEEMLKNQSTVTEKSLIISTINRYKHGGYNENYREKVETLMKLASKVDSLYDELKLQILNDDYFDAKNNLEKRISSIITKYTTIQTFFNDLLTIRQETTQPTTFVQVLETIAEFYPEEGKNLFAVIQKDYPQYISEGLQLVRNQYKDKKYFDEISIWLWERRGRYIGDLTWLLTWGRNANREYFDKSEIMYFEYVVDNKINNCYDSIAYHFLNYAYTDKLATFRILEKFIKTATRHNIGTFIFSTFNAQQTYDTDFSIELKKLFEDNPEKFQFVDASTNMLYSFVDLQFGFETLLEFIDNKLRFDISHSQHISFNDNKLYVNPQINKEESFRRFIVMLKKYISADKDDLKRSKIMLELFRPDRVFSPELGLELRLVIEVFKNSKDDLIRLAEGLQVLSMTEGWIDTISFIADQIVQIDPGFQNFEDVFGYTFYLNHGGKSKTGKGIPYDQDTDRKLMLEKLIVKNKFASVTPFLQKCLNKVNKDIQESIARDNDSLDW